MWLGLLVLFTGWATDFVDICRASPDLRYPSMAEISSASLPVRPRLPGWRGIVADWSSDQRAFKQVSWKKAMMWIFLLSDTFIFSCFLISYMTARMSTTVPWPNPSEVFALHMFGQNFPLLLIAIMTFVLISSSGTMALAVNYGYRRDRRDDGAADAGHRGARRRPSSACRPSSGPSSSTRASAPGAIPGAPSSSARPSS